MSIIEFLFNKISRVHHLLFGSKRLRAYEKACLDAWMSTLPNSIQGILKRQLEKFDLIQRQARGLKTVFYCLGGSDWSENDLLPIKDKYIKVFRAEIVGVIEDVTESVEFTIFLHNGRLFSIEYKSQLGSIKSTNDRIYVINKRSFVEW